MTKKKSRAEIAGENTAKAIIEMVNLMYQNKTALNFYKGLDNILYAERTKRENDKQENKNAAD